MNKQIMKITKIEIKSEDKEFQYVKELTKKLDLFDGNYSQAMINEIVLWKVGRYAELDKKTIGFINQITKTSRKINIKLTREILIHLLTTKGIRLPMASTILRFKNPKIYQIIDQRVYRLITGKELKLSQSKSAKYIEAQINLYLEYLEKLRNTCKENNIDFKQSDRILYKIDKRVNGQINIKY